MPLIYLASSLFSQKSLSSPKQRSLLTSGTSHACNRYAALRRAFN